MSARYKYRREQEKARALAQIDGVLRAEYEEDLDPTLETVHRIQFLNGLYYCKAHARDICSDCKLFSLKLRNLLAGFKLPPNNVPDLPWQCIRDVPTDPSKEEEATMLAQRWLWMQQVYYSLPSNNMPEFDEENKHIIKLPELSKVDETKVSADEIRQHLLPIFETLRGIAGSQRYQFAIQSSALITDYDTFIGGKEVLEEGFAALFDNDGDSLFTGPVRSILTAELEPDEDRVRLRLHAGARLQEKAKFHILNVFGYLLENRTISSFWRILELTATSLIDHVKNFDEEEEGKMVMSEKAKQVLLQLITQVFWSMLYCQHQIAKFRNLQHQICQKNTYPFYSYHLPALEADLDIHLIVLKISTVNLWNVPHAILLLQDFKLACEEFPEQIHLIDSSVMGAIDEFAARFEAFRLVLNAAQYLISEADVKNAITKYRFDVKDKDVSARHDELLCLSETYRDVTKLRNPGLVGDVPILYKLVTKENRFRRFHSKEFFMMFDEVDLDSEITEKQFEVLRARYLHLFPVILSHWAEDERSLLSSAEAKRWKQPERSGQKKDHKSNKRKHKQKSSFQLAGTTKVLQVETCKSKEEENVQALDRDEPIPDSACMDPKMFWPETEILAYNLDNPMAFTPPQEDSPSKEREFLLPLPVSYNCVQVVSRDGCNSKSQAPASNTHSKDGFHCLNVHHCLEKMNGADRETRDILWGKIKDTLEWKRLVQFLTHIGCEVEHLLGSRRKVVDPVTRRCAILYEPHNRDYCRPDERQTYHAIIQHLLGLQYEQLLTPREKLQV